MIIGNVDHSSVEVSFGLFSLCSQDEWLHSFFQAQSFCLFVRFSFTFMLYVISLTRTSVKCHKAVNRVNFLTFLL